MTMAVTWGRKVRLGRIWRQYFRLSFSNNYASGGETLSFAGANLTQSNRSRSSLPLEVAVNGSAGFIYQYVEGASRDVGKINVFCNTAGAANAALGELTVGAYPVGVTGDAVIRGHADFDA